MAVKRRIVWLDDDTWAELGERARIVGVTRSRFIAADYDRSDPWPEEIAAIARVERHAVHGLAIGHDPAKDGRVPFSPAPKPGKRK